MGKKLHFDKATEQKAADTGAAFTHSADVMGSTGRSRTDGAAFSAGTDAFFGRSAFGSAPAVTRSAPMGAEQGGLLEWFKGLFGRSGNGEESAAPEEMPAAPAQDAAEMDAQQEGMQADDPQKQLSDMAEALHNSSKWGLHNSDKFTRVSNAISASLVKLRTPLSGDPAQDQAVLDDIVASFDELIRACEDYLSRDPSTNKGKHRQDIVRQVLNMAVKDRLGFVMQTPNEGERFTSAMDILTSSRQRTLQLVDKKEEELQHVGGAASYIAKIDKGMLTDRNASGYFKQEENFTLRGNQKRILLDALESAKQKITLSEEQCRALEAVIMEKGSLGNAEKDLPGYNNDRKLHDAVTLINHSASAYRTQEANIPNPLKFGESLSLSKRNVATSRLAELLGLGDLVARSETATLVDADKKTSRSGNLMQTAEGREVQGFIVDQFHDDYAKERKKQTRQSDVHLNANMDDKVTPEFLQSLMALQVLDNLAAQEDRHAGNYFAQITKDGKLGKVQAIDNDFSFSNRSLKCEKGDHSIGTHGKNILDAEGNLTIPYMDKALADRITALDEQVLRDVMADVLEPWAINALCVRFKQVKNAIQKDQEKTPGRYLEKDSDWKRKEVFNSLRNGYDEQESMGLGRMQTPTNYVSYLLMSADLSNKNVPVSSAMNFQGYLEDDYVNRLCDAVLDEVKNMGDAEKAKAHLKAYGVEDGILSYLETTGQLFDGHELRKRLPDTELKSPISNTIMELQSKKGQTS